MEKLPEYLIDHAEEAYCMECRDEFGNVNLFAIGSGGDTLLHVAVGQCDSDAVRFLVGKGLDINAKGDYFQTPYFVAAMGNPERNDEVNAEMRELLLELGADPSIPDHRGTLPAHYEMLRRSGPS